ncbi:MAG: acireductone synthase [Gammaproteobacteria bacterium]|jgi:enolase-phosphatase E1|nr:acireductone synthase [Gammaproteobacteria bacterium]
MIKAIVTDIEGTTTSLSFVKDVLFPYARKHLADFIGRHANDAEVREQLEAVCREVGSSLTDQQAVSQLLQWIDEDKKITPLKALQGMIWEAGYKNADYTGHVYPDAVVNLKKWHAQGIRLYVFSSGSVQAQKLIYGYSDAGDLTPLFSGYFDTRIGSKREVGAYQHIAQQIGEPAQSILFLSDIKEELEAAEQAGMQTVWLVREGEPDPDAAHKQVSLFDDIKLV